jgi:hypothetical protein
VERKREEEESRGERRGFNLKLLKGGGRFLFTLYSLVKGEF